MHARDWDSRDDDATPIDEASLAALDGRLDSILAAIRAAGIDPPRVIQAGIEVNAEGALARPFFLANLARKLERARAVLDRYGMQATEVLLHTRGTSPPALAEVRAILAGEAGLFVDRLGHSLYDFEGGWRRPLPGGWLERAVGDLLAIAAETRPGLSVDVAELGAPGNAPAGLVLGYPRADGSFEPVAALDPFEHARYLVECALVALAAGAERVFLYHALAREPQPGDPAGFAENHFGLVSWAGRDPSSGERRPGFPYPSFCAVAALHRALDGRSVGAGREIGDAVVLELRPRPGRAGIGPVLVAWATGEGARTIPWSTLRPGLAVEEVERVEDLFGAPLARGEALLLEPEPTWVWLRPAASDARGASGTAAFDALPLAGGRVALRDRSRGTPLPDERRWDFGDGTTSRARNPIHAFAAPGTYEVTLEVAARERPGAPCLWSAARRETVCVPAR